jgi:hypothetical protein
MFSSINSIHSNHTKPFKYTTPSVKSVAVGTILNLSPVSGSNSGNKTLYSHGAMSTDESYIFLYGVGNYSMISVTSGDTWQIMHPIYWNTTISAYQNAGHAGRHISNDKQVLFFGKYLSINGGSTWTVLSAALYSTSISSDGRYLYYAMQSGSGINLFGSSDYGVTFTQMTGASINLGNGFPANVDRSFRAVNTSSSGQVVAVHCALAVGSGGGLYVSTNYGSTFALASSTIAPGFGNYISVTDSGIMYGFNSGATNINQSTNYGSTFSTLTSYNQYTVAVRPSIEGTHWIIVVTSNVRGFVYSNDSGATRTNFSLYGDQRSVCAANNNSASGVNALNTVGQSLIFNGQGPTLTWKISNNLKNFSYLGPSQLNKNGMIPLQTGSNSLSMSSNGQYILMGWNQGSSNNILSMSNNYGVSWTPINWNNPSGGWPLSTVSGQFPSTSYTWQTTSMSSDGKVMIACSQTSTAYVFLSTNYGGYFDRISGPGNTRGLPTTIVNTWSWSAVSSNGTVILLVANGLSVYVSTNSGTSFTTFGVSNGLPAATSTWSFCAMASNNSNYMLISGAAGLYLSSNTGTSWTKKDGTGNTIGLPTTNASYTSLSISRNGSTMLAIQSAIYYSTNYCASWVRLDGPSATNGLPVTSTSNFSISSISGDGQKILTGVVSGAAYLSTNGGTSFTTISSASSANGFLAATTGNWGQMYISDNGQQFYINIGSVCLCYDGIGQWWSSINWRTDFNLSAQGFGALPVGNIYNVVKFSADGTVVLGGVGTTVGGGTLYISYDGGYSFNFIQNRGQLHGTSAASFNINWLTGSISSDGKNMLLGQTNGVYLTTNYGLIWLCIAGSLAPTAAISTGLPTTTQTWSCSAMSSTGTVSILGISAGALYLSTNSFVTYSIISGTSSQFTSNGLPITNQNWNKLECSYDGSVILASGNSGGLYLTINTGSSWATISGAANSYSMPTSASAWSSIAVSGTDGTYMLATVNSGGMYLSTNKGTTWTQISGISNALGLPSTASAWTCSAISQDGLIMAAAINNGFLYYSTNSGASWTNYVYPYKCSTQNFPWYSISMTADGSKAFVTLNGADYFIITFTKQY